MTSIKTAGDLRKALSAYADDLPLEFHSDGQAVFCFTDLQICRIEQPGASPLLRVDLLSAPEKLHKLS